MTCLSHAFFPHLGFYDDLGDDMIHGASDASLMLLEILELVISGPNFSPIGPYILELCPGSRPARAPGSVCDLEQWVSDIFADLYRG